MYYTWQSNALSNSKLEECVQGHKILRVSYITANLYCICLLRQMQYRFTVIYGSPCMYILWLKKCYRQCPILFRPFFLCQKANYTYLVIFSIDTSLNLSMINIVKSNNQSSKNDINIQLWQFTLTLFLYNVL